MQAEKKYCATPSIGTNPLAMNGMVTSPHHLATQAGLAILRKGGNAIDAAIATAAVLAVAAGADMVLTSQPETRIAQVFSALEEGRLTWERVEQAALRVIAWKIRLGLIPV